MRVIMNKKFINPTPLEKEVLDYVNAKTNHERHPLVKHFLQRDPKRFMTLLNAADLSSEINKPFDVINVCQNLNPKDISFKNPEFGRMYFNYYSYNLIRLERLDEALELLKLVSIELMEYLHYNKALIFTLQDQPENIYNMISEMKDSGVDQYTRIKIYLYSSDWYALKGDYDRQKEWASLALNILIENDTVDQADLAWANFGLGNYQNSLTTYKELIQSEGRTDFYLGIIGICYANSGLEQEANKQISELKLSNTPESYYRIAQIYTALDDKGTAVQYLLKAFEEDYGFRLGRYDTDPLLVPLHGHPDYEKIVKPKG